MGFYSAICNPWFVLLVLYTVSSSRRCLNTTFWHKNGFWVLTINNSNCFIAHTSGSFTSFFSSHSIAISSRNGISKCKINKYILNRCTRCHLYSLQAYNILHRKSVFGLTNFVFLVLILYSELTYYQMFR